MTTGDWIAFGGDVLVFVSLLTTFFVFLAQRASSAEELRQSSLAVLTAAQRGIAPWGPLHFGTDYSGTFGDKRADQDRNLIAKGRAYQQNFRVPTEPLASIIQQPDEGRYITVETIEAVNIALWRVGQFNQIVEQQTNFISRHAADILGTSIHQLQRNAIADAAHSISLNLHKTVIGDGAWYSELTNALDRNISALNAIGQRRWWQVRRPSLPGYE